ncbi:MAG: proton-conducting transporter membrane subunit, partial [Thermoanaerobaculia bacterium]
MLTVLWLIPLLPFLGFLLNGLFGKRLGKAFVSAVALLATGASAIASTLAVVQYHAAYPNGERYVQVVYNWIRSGNIGADIAFQLDPLTVVMLMVVTWIGFLIHLYSVGYMSHEEGYGRYFAYLNLFLAEMLVLILGSSYLLMFVGWEGVGLCSYLLIGFYYKTDYAPAAGKKAFVVNRIGDFGFALGIFGLFFVFKTINLDALFAAAPSAVGKTMNFLGYDVDIMTVLCLLLF